MGRSKSTRRRTCASTVASNDSDVVSSGDVDMMATDVAAEGGTGAVSTPSDAADVIENMYLLAHRKAGN